MSVLMARRTSSAPVSQCPPAGRRAAGRPRSPAGRCRPPPRGGRWSPRRDDGQDGQLDLDRVLVRGGRRSCARTAAQRSDGRGDIALDDELVPGDPPRARGRRPRPRRTSGGVVGAQDHDGRRGRADAATGRRSHPAVRRSCPGVDEAGVRDEDADGRTPRVSRLPLAAARRSRRPPGRAGHPAGPGRTNPATAGSRSGGPLPGRCGHRSPAARPIPASCRAQVGQAPPGRQADPCGVAAPLDDTSARNPRIGCPRARAPRRCRHRRAPVRPPARWPPPARSVAIGVGGTSRSRYAGWNRLTCQGVSRPSSPAIQPAIAASSVVSVVVPGDHERRDLEPHARRAGAPRWPPAPCARRAPHSRR